MKLSMLNCVRMKIKYGYEIFFSSNEWELVKYYLFKKQINCAIQMELCHSMGYHKNENE